MKAAKILRRVRVRVPASTANLGPGFDVLGMALALYNDLELAALPLHESPLVIEIEGEGAHTLPRDERNVVARAVKRVFDAAGHPAPPLKITLTNRIPLARGLGSSAAAVIGGLVAANTWLGKPLDERNLLALGLELEGHPDNLVPALKGDLCVARAHQGQVRYARLRMLANLAPVVCVPGFELATLSARAKVPTEFRREDVVFNLGNALLLVAALTAHRDGGGLLAEVMDDRLHQPYRQELIPGMLEVFAAARQAGAVGVALSGAGPSLLALAESPRKAAAIGAAMEQAFHRRGIESRALVLSVDRRGARLLDRG